jgi:hypothetical protein
MVHRIAPKVIYIPIPGSCEQKLYIIGKGTLRV